MKKYNNILVYIILTISLFINVALYIRNQIAIREIESYKDAQLVLNEEILVINSLIPKLNPTITKIQLVEEIKRIKPDEIIDVLDDHICWRFYRFWFSKDGKIESVTYGS
jgi:hypothetical protein